MVGTLQYTDHYMAVLSDLGRVPQMPLDDMMEMVIPSLLSKEEVDAILVYLRTSKVAASL